MTEPRVAVLGAGVAGLAAARALSEAGVKVDLLEARDRLGGRVLELRGIHWPLPIELGAEFVHGEPEVIAELAKAAGLALNQLNDRHHFRLPGREVLADQPLVELPDFWERTQRILSSVAPGAPDISAAEFADRSGLSPEDRSLFEIFVEGFHAAPFDDVSVQSLAQDAQATSSAAPTQSRIAGGYGRLVDWLAERAIASGRTEVRLSSRVRHVLWQPGEVRLDVEGRAGAEQRSARALIVTAPVSVLRTAPDDGGIGFDPPLREKHAAWGLAGVGHVAKLVLLFREQFWDDRAAPNWEFLHDPASRFFTFWRQSSGEAQQITAWAGGPRALALSGQRNMELVHDALGTLSGLLAARPMHAESLLAGAHLHAFSEDRFARGAYGYARVGGEKVHDALATPLAQTLFFAGEATDSDNPATVAGALASGQRAAREVLRAL